MRKSTGKPSDQQLHASPMPKTLSKPFALLARGGGLAQKVDSTLRYAQAVPDPSTNRALTRLTLEVKRDPVHSTRYGRQRQPDGAMGHS